VVVAVKTEVEVVVVPIDVVEAKFTVGE